MTIATANDQGQDHIWAQPSCDRSCQPMSTISPGTSSIQKFVIVFGLFMLFIQWFALMIVGISQYYEKPWDLFIYWATVSTSFSGGGLLACQGLQ